jgi:hypothetical protein
MISDFTFLDSKLKIRIQDCSLILPEAKTNLQKSGNASIFSWLKRIKPGRQQVVDEKRDHISAGTDTEKNCITTGNIILRAENVQ